MVPLDAAQTPALGLDNARTGMAAGLAGLAGLSARQSARSDRLFFAVRGTRHVRFPASLVTDKRQAQVTTFI
jgi:hypothetical protein